eukprot:scaffold108.g4566.t1
MPHTSSQMAPVGNFLASVVGPIVDPRYTEVCYLWFGIAVLMWLTLFVWTFQKQARVLGHNADPRGRMFSGIWIAAPAVGGIAWAVLTAPAPGAYVMGPVSQAMFYMAVVLGLLILYGAWRRFFWTDKFFMMMWAFGFPTAALAWAGILYDATIQTALSKALAVCLIALASVVAFVLTVRTLGGVARLKASEALRHLARVLREASAGLAAAPRNARLAGRARICFPQIGTFFPGHEKAAIAQNARLLEMCDQASPPLGRAGANGGLPTADCRVDTQVQAVVAAARGGAEPGAAAAAGRADADADVARLPGATLEEQVAAAIASSQVRPAGPPGP